MCRPSSNTAASPKDQGRCLLHVSHFQKMLVGFQRSITEFTVPMCCHTSLCRRAILQEKPIEAAGGGRCQANFICRQFSTADKIAFRQSEHHDQDVDLILLDRAGQIIATSHDLTPNGGLVREIPLFQGNRGW